MDSNPLPSLQLGDAQPVALGRNRIIYQHPQNDGWLVKVFRPEKIEQPEPRYKFWHSPAHEKGLARELKEYKSLRRKNLHDLAFIQRFYGKVETDLGPGMVVEKLRGADGGLAPTITKLVLEGGMTRELRSLMHELRDEVIEHNIIFTDVSGSNIVLAHDRHGERLVIIDGLGDRLWLPVNAMIAQVNKMNRRRHFERAINWLEKSSPEKLKLGIVDLD